jgi:hypothetical protein
MKFARLLDFETGQLLVSITTDSDVKGYVLSVETYHQGAFIRSGVPFPSFSDASDAMNKLTDDHAEQIFHSLTCTIAGSSDTVIDVEAALKGFENWLVLRNY